MMVLIQMDFPLHPKRTPWKFSRFQAVHLADPRWAKFPFWHPFNMIFFHNLGPGSSKKAEIRVELQLQHEAHSSAFFVVKDLDLCIWSLITGIDPSLHFPTKRTPPIFFVFQKRVVRVSRIQPEKTHQKITTNLMWRLWHRFRVSWSVVECLNTQQDPTTRLRNVQELHQLFSLRSSDKLLWSDPIRWMMDGWMESRSCWDSTKNGAEQSPAWILYGPDPPMVFKWRLWLLAGPMFVGA